MKVLVTGGAGYIGSHTLIELINAGHSPVVIDSLTNSHTEAIKRVEAITGTSIPFYSIDLCNRREVEAVFADHQFEAVIHFAGLKAVGESVQQPLRYYRNNLDSTLSLLEVMQSYGVTQLIFSSSATVYGTADIPYTESSSTGQGITNPYGQTKYMIEQIMQDYAAANPKVTFTALRYFNPIGAHPSGQIGEDPSGVPNNLMPFITQVASGQRDKLAVFGDDYPTPDGTCIRDYIHVIDLARGHVAALAAKHTGFQAYNLGSGTGTSVLELIQAFEQATDQTIPYEITPRRDGDLPEFYADPAKAQQDLNWTAEKTIQQACQDAWRWQSQNPQGYA